MPKNVENNVVNMPKEKVIRNLAIFQLFNYSLVCDGISK